MKSGIEPFEKHDLKNIGEFLTFVLALLAGENGSQGRINSSAELQKSYCNRYVATLTSNLFGQYCEIMVSFYFASL